MDRSHAGSLTLQTLGEYCASLHTDILHSVDQTSYTVPQVEKMINLRLEFQNAVSTVQRWNDEIANCDAIKDMTCINKVKHREYKTFVDKELYEQDRIICYGYISPRVVFVGESTEEGGSGSGSGSNKLTGRGRRGRQPHAGFSRDDMNRHSATK